MSELDDYTALPYPIAAGFRDKPTSTANVNIGTAENPVYKECNTYPAYPWALSDFIQNGDGRESEFIPTSEEPDDHGKDNPKKFWDLCMAVDAVPKPIHVRPIPGKMDYEQ